jgi:putative ABC transport system substrate-binding protein
MLDLKRREVIALLGGVAAGWPIAALAQQPDRIPTIGYLGLTPVDRLRPYDDAFREGLRDLGYVDGRNLRIEYRSSEGDESRIPALAAELVALSVNAIVTYATGVPAAQRATSTIPIVMAAYANVGMFSSIARPGGNITGSTFFLPELMAKRLELIKDVVPSMTRAGVLLLRRDDNAANRNILAAMEGAAKALHVELQPIEVIEPRDYPRAFATWADQRIDALVVLDHAQFIANAGALAALAAAHRFPSVGPLELPASGGLMAYGVDFAILFRRAAAFVDKILKGAKPGDIPVEQATTFVSVLNLKTAKALGIDMPTSILLRADKVIE